MFDRLRRIFSTFSHRATETGDDQRLMAAHKFLIVGLGNPGRKYRYNRHNVGFLAVDRLARRHGVASDRVEQRAIVGKVHDGDNLLILVKPQTFMNSSGDSVGPLVAYYDVPLENVLVIYDEIDLPFGTLRLRAQGGAAGHNGMRSIINHLGNGFARLRLGVGRPPGKMPVSAYVLQDFGKDEQPLVDQMLDEAVAAIETFVHSGIDLAMSRHNSQVSA